MSSQLVKITDGVWARAVPHSFVGLSLGTRMTVVRRRDGTVLLHSPVPIDDATAREIDALGKVTDIVAPSLYHHVYAGAAADRYRDATLHAPRALRKKRKDLRIGADLDERSQLGDEFVAVPIDGCDLGETVLVHLPSKTVVSADLVENFRTAPPDLYTRLYLKAAGIDGKVGWSRLLKIVYRDRKAARRSLDRLSELDWDRAMLAHGDILESNAKAQIREALEWIR